MGGNQLCTAYIIYVADYHIAISVIEPWYFYKSVSQEAHKHSLHWRGRKSLVTLVKQKYHCEERGHGGGGHTLGPSCVPVYHWCSSALSHLLRVHADSDF